MKIPNLFPPAAMTPVAVNAGVAGAIPGQLLAMLPSLAQRAPVAAVGTADVSRFSATSHHYMAGRVAAAQPEQLFDAPAEWERADAFAQEVFGEDHGAWLKKIKTALRAIGPAEMKRMSLDRSASFLGKCILLCDWWNVVQQNVVEEWKQGHKGEVEILLEKRAALVEKRRIALVEACKASAAGRIPDEVVEGEGFQIPIAQFLILELALTGRTPVKKMEKRAAELVDMALEMQAEELHTAPRGEATEEDELQSAAAVLHRPLLEGVEADDEYEDADDGKSPLLLSLSPFDRLAAACEAEIRCRHAQRQERMLNITVADVRASEVFRFLIEERVLKMPGDAPTLARGPMVRAASEVIGAYLRAIGDDVSEPTPQQKLGVERKPGPPSPPPPALTSGPPPSPRGRPRTSSQGVPVVKVSRKLRPNGARIQRNVW